VSPANSNIIFQELMIYLKTYISFHFITVKPTVWENTRISKFLFLLCQFSKAVKGWQSGSSGRVLA
jgi:hypothetical protein